MKRNELGLPVVKRIVELHHGIVELLKSDEKKTLFQAKLLVGGRSGKF